MGNLLYANVQNLITYEWFFRIIIKSVSADTDYFLLVRYNKTIVNDRVVIYA